ncbi:MAG: phosphoribosylformylglycinamidine synthase subunit PurQ [Hyphomicrobiales bacterium]|nr:phosphoribosylformylglycinamidine synthase subunit PurQ [Hyphomicrobiales bacterium]OQW81811.1 MAG: phosphoribosylformylglycinamidine synthase I [Proteobacteria bacterium ST_bin15]
MKTSIIVFPGSNRDRDLGRAFRQTDGGEPAYVWHDESELPAGTDIVALPGGFSYGDYLRCGAIAARSPVMRAVAAHAKRGGFVIGICNGFQILCENGLLPGVLMRNERLKFLCRTVTLKVENAETPFTHGYAAGALLRVPIAHGEGNYQADTKTLTKLEKNGQVVFRYVDEAGAASDSANINGAARAIAGIINDKGNVLGMMPHPENAIEPLQGSSDGAGIFRSLALTLEKVA